MYDSGRLYEDCDNFGIPSMKIGLAIYVPSRYSVHGAEELKEESGRGWKLEDLAKIQRGEGTKCPTFHSTLVDSQVIPHRRRRHWGWRIRRVALDQTG